jgi:dihydrofolate reductase
MYDFATRIVNTKKIVFTRSLEKSKWENTDIAKGDLKEEIQKLKLRDGKDLIVYGGSSFVSLLIKEKLIDEFHFFINPIAIGSGASAFEHLDNWQHLKLRNCITCKSGLVLLHYDRI